MPGGRAARRPGARQRWSAPSSSTGGSCGATEREGGGGSLQLARFLPAGGAPGEMAVDGRDVARGQGPERMLRQSIAHRRAVHTSSLPSFAFRTLIIAERSRVLTVPSGMPSIPRSARSSRKYARHQATLGLGERGQRLQRRVPFDQHGFLVEPRSIGHLVDEHEGGPGDSGSRRSRSTARLCAIVISHVERRPREGSNRAALRHAVRKTSCVSSSADSRVPSSR